MAFLVIFPCGTRADTKQFTVEAQRFVGIGLVAERSSCERNSNGRTTGVDVCVNSVPGSTIVASGDGITDQLVVENTVKAGEYYLRTRALP